MLIWILTLHFIYGLYVECCWSTSRFFYMTELWNHQEHIWKTIWKIWKLWIQFIICNWKTFSLFERTVASYRAITVIAVTTAAARELSLISKLAIFVDIYLSVFCSHALSCSIYYSRWTQPWAFHMKQMLQVVRHGLVKSV